MANVNNLDATQLPLKLAGYHETPIIFVTAVKDFENRLRSARSGGADFITKPFLFAEVAVKAIICILQPRTEPAVGATAFRPFGAGTG